MNRHERFLGSLTATPELTLCRRLSGICAPLWGTAEDGAVLGPVWAGPGKGQSLQSLLPTPFFTPVIPSHP